MDITTLGYALRLQWEWLARIESARLWSSILNKTKQVVQGMFELSTTAAVEVGNEEELCFGVNAGYMGY
jgi:hypothetical protein